MTKKQGEDINLLFDSLRKANNSYAYKIDSFDRTTIMLRATITNKARVVIYDQCNNINQTPGKNKKIVPIKENSTANSAGEYNGPIELGQKKSTNRR